MRRVLWRVPEKGKKPPMIWRFFLVSVLWMAISPGQAPGTAAPPVFKVSISEDGVYQVRFDDLQTAGLGAGSLSSATMGLTSAGKPVPIWLEDGGDGHFEQGDWFEFLGESPRGEVAYHHEYATLNVYWLRIDDPRPARMRAPQPQGLPIRDGGISRYQVRQHLEWDRMMLRFSSQSQQNEDLWYWGKLSHIDKNPFRYDLRLEGLDVTSSEPVKLRLRFRGWSKPRSKTDPTLSDHRVEMFLNDKPVDQVEWNGQDYSMLAVEVPPPRLQPGSNALDLRVPARKPEGARDPLIDVVVLDWIEVSYPHDGSIGEGQIRLGLPADAIGSTLSLRPSAENGLVVYSHHGFRSEVGAAALQTGPKGRLAEVRGLYRESESGPRSIQVVPAGQWQRPAAVELDTPSELADAANQADYIMITHPRLRQAIEPLVEFHRRRGLTVTLVDIRDVYDEFNHGVLHPRAIRDFLHRAYHGWQDPAPRFVLLVGDASWDPKNTKARGKNYAAWTYRSNFGFGLDPTHGTPYADKAKLNHRNLIPTWNYLTTQGHAASDNGFVTVDGDDILPDMAIGRFPVSEPREIAAIVEKTIQYAERPVVGPWRRRVLWISDGSAQFNRYSDHVAATVATRGFSGVQVKPLASDPTNEHHRERLKASFDQGELLVHFVGHGGRFIWRTAPADFKKNLDLFRLEDLDQLEAHGRLPIIVSMTCYSAPFDHPNSDSIGEKFLRLPDRGAVGVIAASWRVIPSRRDSELLMARLTEPNSVVGESLRRAKRDSGSEQFNYLFNLLGDPALPISLPVSSVDLELQTEDPPTLAVQFGQDPFTGQAIIDWMNAEGEVLESESFQVEEARFGRTFQGDVAELAVVRVYVWSEEQGVDGIGTLRLRGDRHGATGSR